jgi:hypothetical protein
MPKAQEARLENTTPEPSYVYPFVFLRNLESIEPSTHCSAIAGGDSSGLDRNIIGTAGAAAPPPSYTSDSDRPEQLTKRRRRCGLGGRLLAHVVVEHSLGPP